MLGFSFSLLRRRASGDEAAPLRNNFSVKKLIYVKVSLRKKLLCVKVSVCTRFFA